MICKETTPMLVKLFSYLLQSNNTIYLGLASHLVLQKRVIDLSLLS
jgi:hypothetical protein